MTSAVSLPARAPGHQADDRRPDARQRQDHEDPALNEDRRQRRAVWELQEHGTALLSGWTVINSRHVVTTAAVQDTTMLNTI